MKFIQHKPIVLASGSPRRIEYLNRYHLDFSVVKSNISENSLPGEKSNDYVKRIAREKALSIVSNKNKFYTVIAADTIVVLDSEILGKPGSSEEVYPMLKRLNGATHQVITSYVIHDGDSGEMLQKSTTTKVTFNKVNNELLHKYAETTEPLDKAGAYSIQGIGTFLVRSIEGSYNNVVGLPVEALLIDLLNMGIISTI